MKKIKIKPVIEKIIQIEWEMFQRVNNIGGRAECQDDFDTFFAMRVSQYYNWSDRMLDCYGDFAKACRETGRNLVEEKYGRMMQYTDLHYYNKYVKPHMEPVPIENYRLINRIVPILIKWEEEFAEMYPKLAGAGRPISSEGDATGFTSMETYARGELETYPTELLASFLGYIEELGEQGKSLSLMIQETTVNLYGYDSIQAAEDSIVG